MPLSQRWTLTGYLIEERRRFPGASGDLNALLLDVSLACKAIARKVAFGRLDDAFGSDAAQQGGAVNVQGEVPKLLDVIGNDIFIRMNEWSGHLAGTASCGCAAGIAATANCWRNSRKRRGEAV